MHFYISSLAASDSVLPSHFDLMLHRGRCCVNTRHPQALSVVALITPTPSRRSATLSTCRQLYQFWPLITPTPSQLLSLPIDSLSATLSTSRFLSYLALIHRQPLTYTLSSSRFLRYNKRLYLYTTDPSLSVPL